MDEMKTNDLTFKKNINSLRMYLLQYLLKCTNAEHTINITDAGKYLTETYGVVLHRETLTKILKELYTYNDIFQKTFQFEIVRVGNGNKLRYYARRFLNNDMISDLCMAVDREVMVLPDKSEQISANLKNMLTIYDEQVISEIISSRKKKSNYSIIFEDYLKLAKSAMKQKQLVRIEYYNDVKSIRKDNYEFYSKESHLYKIEGYIIDIARIFNTPYLKVVSRTSRILKYISLFDISYLEKIITYGENLHSEDLKIVDNSIELGFCLENASDDAAFSVKFKELFDITIETDCSEKYIIYVINEQNKTKRIMDFSTIKDCEMYIASATEGITCSAPVKKQYYQVVIDRDLAIKWLMSPEVWGNILIIRPIGIVSEMYNLALKLIKKLKDNYTYKQ